MSTTQKKPYARKTARAGRTIDMQPPVKWQEMTGNRAITVDCYKGEPDFLYHCHPGYELVMTRGSFGRRLIGNYISNYYDMDFVLIGPDLPHTWVSESNQKKDSIMDNIVVHFTKESLGIELLLKPEMKKVASLMERSKRGISFIGCTITGEVEKLMDQLVTQEGSTLKQFTTFLCIMDSLSTCTDSETILSKEYDFANIHKEYEPFSKVIVYLHEHSNQPITLDEIADVADMSTSTFCRFFRRMTGTTFIDYLNEWRVDRACVLLQETNKSILEISMEVGFLNLSNFNRQFLRRKGFTPRDYRRPLPREYQPINE